MAPKGNGVGCRMHPIFTGGDWRNLPMREVVQSIIATEGEARRIVEAARTEAERIMSEARKKGYDMIERVRQDTLVETEKMIGAAVKAAEEEKERLLTETAAEIEGKIRFDPTTRQQVIERVVRCVCKQV